MRGASRFLLVTLFSTGVLIAQEDLLPDADLRDSFDRQHEFLMQLSVNLLRSGETPTWEATLERSVTSGDAVSLRITGHNLTLLVKITPYPAEKGDVSLYFQGWVWLSLQKGQGIHRIIHRNIIVQPEVTVTVYPLGEEFTSRRMFMHRWLRQPDDLDAVDSQTVAISITVHTIESE